MARSPGKFRVHSGSGGMLGAAAKIRKQSSGANNAFAHAFAKKGSGGGGALDKGGGVTGPGSGVDNLLLEGALADNLLLEGPSQEDVLILE